VLEDTDPGALIDEMIAFIPPKAEKWIAPGDR
jgi:hypothetical protein